MCGLLGKSANGTANAMLATKRTISLRQRFVTRVSVVKNSVPVVCLFLCLIFPALSHASRDIPADPFESVMWKLMVERHFPGGEVVFDSRVKVSAPKSAENQFHVPITVDATELSDVEEIVAVADLNPIAHILTVRPKKSLSFVGFRVKLQQATPIHVGVRTSDGVWHMGGAYIDAAGGGCTAPAMAHGMNNWMKTLGKTRASTRRESPLSARMTIRMRHPMDTGLAAGIPAFFMNQITVQDAAGETVAELDLYEPVSENPTITIKPKVGQVEETLSVLARDTEGNEFGFPLTVPAVAAQ